MSEFLLPSQHWDRATQAAQRSNQHGLGMLNLIAELQHREQMRPLQMEELRARALDREGQARLREAQIAELGRKNALAGQQDQARGALANLLSTGGYSGVDGQGAPVPMAVANNDAAAIEAVRRASAEGRPMSVNVPNPGNVQGLSVLADPTHAIPEVLRQGRPPTDRQRYVPVSNGYIDVATGEFKKTTADPTPPREAMVAIKGDDGKPVFVPSSQAAGRTPASLSGREDDHMLRRVMQFGQAMDKSGFATTYATLKEATDRATADVLPYLTGPGSALPDNPLMSTKITDARQALQRILNITLKDRSGAAVTNPEWERFKKEAGVGLLKKPEQVTAWLGQAKTILDKHYAGVAAGFPADVRDRYFQELGDVAPFGTQSAPAAGGWNDDKERRYQELLRKRGGS